ncbi:MAG TPA: NUDIX hydrolase [Patescibacteria group bacterium]|nr:NUDIX hydrolase [Patescibacteria group bacterium]
MADDVWRKSPRRFYFRETAIRELEEEVGIFPDPNKLFLVEETKRSARYIYPFHGHTSDLHFSDGEIEKIKWMSLDEYHAEENAHPESWCNLIKPHQEAIIRDWITKQRLDQMAKKC